MNTNTDRDQGKQAQIANITAAKAVADIIRTTLGPRSMLKMILDPMGGIVMTNDGNCILREIDVSHPAAKSMIELSRTQDEEVGDGTTSVIVMAGEMLHVAQPFMEKKSIHPTVVVGAFTRALTSAMERMGEIARVLDSENREEIMDIIRATVGTKFTTRFGDLICQLALDATLAVSIQLDNGKKDIDLKRYCRVERIPGGEFKDCKVLDGIMINKDVVHAKMTREVPNPKVLCIDGNLDYTKGESQTNIEIEQSGDWEKYLEVEEEWVKTQCDHIAATGATVVVVEKALSDLAQHFLVKAGISAIRRVRKPDLIRIARATCATVITRCDLATEKDCGTNCELFEVRKIGDEYYCYFEGCKDAKACTIVLRGGSDDVLREMERNLNDATAVARNLMQDPRVVPGGGATEMALAQHIRTEANKLSGVIAWPFRAVADALEVIPRTLIDNCGGQIMRTLTQLRAKHADPANATWGIDGCKGTLVDMKEYKVWEPYAVKASIMKTAIESACMLLRIDDVLSGIASDRLLKEQGKRSRK